MARELSKEQKDEITSAMSMGLSAMMRKKDGSGVNPTEPTTPTEPSSINEPTEQAEPTAPKRFSSKHRKTSLEEYRQTFLTVPKIEDRKTVFVSGEVRDRLDEIVRKLGGRKMSVSGLIENLALHHLELYGEDVEAWKRM